MKYALVTRSDDNIKQMTDITHPLLKEYAKKCNADFIIFDHKPQLNTDDNKPHYRILKAQELLKDYDRILFLDSDMIINKNCPNIFDEVPVDCIGSVFEDKGSRLKDRRDKIKGIQKSWGDIGWTGGYTNAGTFVISKEHSKIFDPHKGKYWMGWGSADLHLSYMARKHKYKFHELSYKWNHMTMFSERWNKNANRFDSYIIHYAGKGIYNKKNRIDQIQHDKDIIFKNS